MEAHTSSVKLLKHQWETLRSKAKFKALVSGLGGGKTWCGVHWCIQNAYKYPDSLGFIGATTYGQLRNSTLAAVFNELSRLEIQFEYNQSSGILRFLGKRFLCKSMENYDSLRGFEVGEIWLDEAAYIKKEAYNVIIGRLRDKHGSLELLMTTTPNGYNFVFDYFVGELKTKDHLLIRAKSTDNIHLPKGYLDSLTTQYDEKMREQEIMGEFVNLTSGKIYYAFDREKNVSDFNVNLINGTTYIFCDFNVDPMCSVVAKFVNGKLYIMDEFFLRNSDTYKTVHEWKKKYWGASVIPDSTGKNRKTSGMSDFQIIKESGFQIIYMTNPRVRDRVNNINRLLSDGSIVISPKCIKLINDLEKVSWRGGDIDQKTDPMLSHISDALGYGAWNLKPIELGSKGKVLLY